MIQAQTKSQWVGINTDYVGKPGTSLMCNASRSFPQTAKQHEEEARTQVMRKVFDTLRNIEQHYPLLVHAGSESRTVLHRKPVDFH